MLYNFQQVIEQAKVKVDIVGIYVVLLPKKRNCQLYREVVVVNVDFGVMGQEFGHYGFGQSLSYVFVHRREVWRGEVDRVTLLLIGL